MHQKTALELHRARRALAQARDKFQEALRLWLLDHSA